MLGTTHSACAMGKACLADGLMGEGAAATTVPHDGQMISTTYDSQMTGTTDR